MSSGCGRTRVSRYSIPRGVGICGGESRLASKHNAHAIHGTARQERQGDLRRGYSKDAPPLAECRPTTTATIPCTGLRPMTRSEMRHWIVVCFNMATTSKSLATSTRHPRSWSDEQRRHDEHPWVEIRRLAIHSGNISKSPYLL